MTTGPSTGMRSLSRGVRTCLEQSILFTGAPTSLSHRSLYAPVAATTPTPPHAAAARSNRIVFPSSTLLSVRRTSPIYPERSITLQDSQEPLPIHYLRTSAIRDTNPQKLAFLTNFFIATKKTKRHKKNYLATDETRIEHG